MAASWSAAAESAEAAPEAMVLVELLLEEQPESVSTPAAAMTLIREIKVLLFIIYPLIRMFNFT